MAAVVSGSSVVKSASVSIPHVHGHQYYRRTANADLVTPKFPGGNSDQTLYEARRSRFGLVDHAGTSGNSHHGTTAPNAKARELGPGAGKPATFQLLAQASDTESITPQLLAKHQLPAILLQHGPLAIRHITGLLISAVPGFSSIPPAKQRRLVVGALEGRGVVAGVQGEIGGTEGNVLFEKVGWGRWDARMKGDPPRNVAADMSSFPNAKVLGAIAAAEMQHSTSYNGESGVFIHSEGEMDEAPDASEDHDVDMSMDDDSTSTSSFDDDMTDEEDWANMGAAMLRQQGVSPITSDGWSNSYVRSPPTFSAIKPGGNGFVESPAEKRAREEREAVEALVKLSSI